MQYESAFRPIARRRAAKAVENTFEKKRVVGFTGVKRHRQTRPIRTQRDQGSCAIGKLSLDHFKPPREDGLRVLGAEYRMILETAFNCRF